MKIWKYSFWFATIFWPLSLFLSNTTKDFLNYIFPALSIGLFFIFRRNGSKYYLIPLFITPFLEPKFSILPFFYTTVVWFFEKNNRKSLIGWLLLSLAIIIIFAEPFFGQTIFSPGYEARQEVIRNIYLYPNIPLARIFQNKLNIILNNFFSNFFALIDLNNYFFGFAPLQIVGNQNLVKFPFLSILPFLTSVFYFKKIRDQTLYIFIFSSVLNLTLLTNFDRNDFILWIPLSIILFYGFKVVKDFKTSLLFFIPYLAFSIIEFLRLFHIYN